MYYLCGIQQYFHRFQSFSGVLVTSDSHIIMCFYICSNWVISTQPKYIELSAERIRTNLSEGGAIDNDLMTIAVRRYQQIDYTFALDKEEGCWRHWLEPDFVVRTAFYA